MDLGLRTASPTLVCSAEKETRQHLKELEDLQQANGKRKDRGGDHDKEERTENR